MSRRFSFSANSLGFGGSPGGGAGIAGVAVEGGSVDGAGAGGGGVTAGGAGAAALGAGGGVATTGAGAEAALVAGRLGHPARNTASSSRGATSTALVHRCPVNNARPGRGTMFKPSLVKRQ